MHYLVLLVLDNIELGGVVCDAWEEVGVGGITIMASTGLGRVRQKQGFRDDIPLMPSLRSLLHGPEEHHRTLFSVVEGEAMVDRLIAATEAVIGSLDEPDSGIMIALPVARAVGIQRREHEHAERSPKSDKKKSGE